MPNSSAKRLTNRYETTELYSEAIRQLHMQFKVALFESYTSAVAAEQSWEMSVTECTEWME
jgi:hypothetical protein